MNIEDMTPEQIREYAVAKEQAREDLTAKYMGRPAATVAPRGEQATPPQFVRDVEFEGVSYPVDVRRVKSRAAMRELLRLRAAEDPDPAAMLDYLDRVFAGECADKVVETVEAKMGYDDFEEVLRVESGIMEALDLKN